MMLFVEEETATAQNNRNSGDQHTVRHVSALGDVRALHVMPSGEVTICWATVPVAATAQNNPNWGLQHTPDGAMGLARSVQLTPSGLVMTPAVDETAQNNPSSGDHTTDRHPVLLGTVCALQSVPLLLVMMHWNLVPFSATAQKMPSSGDQQTLIHESALEAVRSVQLIPSGLVAIRCVPLYETAQKRPRCGDQQTEVHAKLGAVRAVHALPSGEVMILPDSATAQNSPSSGDQHTPTHASALALVCALHVIGDVFSKARQAGLGVAAELAPAT